MTLRKVKGNFERLFDKNQTDLVRGIRNNKDNEQKYISQCLEEIKDELRQDNLNVKANAVSKLTYLQMLGYDISWSAFNIIEVMSSTKFTHKRVGYLAASQCFHEKMDLMMLTTNMIRKDLNSQVMYDSGLALSGLACFVNEDIAHDLANDVLIQLNSTKPYLRKKAVLTLYKIFLKYPDALKIAFPRLKEKLEDPDPGVQSAAVNVICELARKNPKNYLWLAPLFFKLMQNSTNNWMLIKIIKLFGALTPIEPRLGTKLLEPLTNLIHSTSAMSLLYECINTVIAVLISLSSGLPNHNASVQLCAQKLRLLIEDKDQNLKYLGLLAMSRILKTHPKSVQSLKDLVLTCLDDKDESIRLRSLDLIIGMISRKNIMEIVHKLMQNVKNNSLGNKYRDELILKIIEICSQNDYGFISNFEWYISVLVDLSRIEGGTIHSSLIARQLFDVTIRVESITAFSTRQMAILLENAEVFNEFCDVLYAAAFICGEFAIYLVDKRQTCLHLLQNHSFPYHIQAVFLQNSIKIFVKLIETEPVDLDVLCDEINHRLKEFVFSDDYEVQERATNFQQILLLVRNNLCMTYSDLQKSSQVGEFLIDGEAAANNNSSAVISEEVVDSSTEAIEIHQSQLIELPEQETSAEIEHQSANTAASEQKIRLSNFFFAYPIKPVAAKAQKKVPIPTDLHLDQPFRSLEDSSEDEDQIQQQQAYESARKDGPYFIGSQKNRSEPASSIKSNDSKSTSDSDLRERIEPSLRGNPMYLKSDKGGQLECRSSANEKFEDTNEIEEAVEAGTFKPHEIPGLISSDKYFYDNKAELRAKAKRDKKMRKDKKRSKKSKHACVEEEEDETDDGTVDQKIKILSLEMPEGVDTANDLDDPDGDENDPHRALANVTFDEFLEKERLEKAAEKAERLKAKHKRREQKEAQKKEKERKKNGSTTEANDEVAALKSKSKKSARTSSHHHHHEQQSQSQHPSAELTNHELQASKSKHKKKSKKSSRSSNPEGRIEATDSKLQATSSSCNSSNQIKKIKTKKTKSKKLDRNEEANEAKLISHSVDDQQQQIDEQQQQQIIATDKDDDTT